MPPTEIGQTIRAARSRDFYIAYLNSPDWRRRRNAALMRAGWRCERCDSKRNLQVHHKSYAHLGAERNDELEVLCDNCHEEHHHNEDAKQHLGVYVKVVSDAYRSEPFDNFADLLDEAKRRCAALKIPTNPEKIGRAVALLADRLDAGKRTKSPLTGQSIPPADNPINKSEASELCRTLGLRIPLRSMPKAKLLTQWTADGAKAVVMIQDEILASIQRCEELERQAQAAKVEAAS